MTSFDGLLFTLIAIGILLIVISFLAIRTNKKQSFKKHEGDLEQEDFIYDEVRNKILELNEYGEYLKGELDGKHKELLFLYQMLSEKDRELREKASLTETSPVEEEKEQIQDNNQFNDQIKLDENELEQYRDMQYNKKILELSVSGHSAQDIARQLDIGTGQVELVLNLFK